MSPDDTKALGTQNPPVRRRELGALLRALRTDAELTIDDVAERLLCSPAKVSRMETGQRGASQRDVRDLCEIYGVADPALYDHLMSLSRQGRGQAWWQPFNLPYATYVGLEAAAAAIRDFEPGVFPGLLQVPAYTRSVHEAAHPRLGDTVIEQRIEERLKRQKILTSEHPPQLHAIVDQAVMHRVVGGAGVMAAQLSRLMAVSELPSVTLQVLPFTAGAHAALDSTFIILDIPAPSSSVVYVEGLAGQIYLERPQDVQRYSEVFERLKGLALNPTMSADLIAKIYADFH